MTDKKDIISVDSYLGAYGPTIRIGIESIEKLLKFRDLFSSLKNGDVKDLKFKDVDGVELTGIEDLIIRRQPKQERQKISMMPGGSNVYVWTLSPDNLFQCEGLIDGLIEGGGSGHQYLTDESDGVLVVVAYGEG